MKAKSARQKTPAVKQQVFGYVRVSTEEQVQEGVSLDAQKEKITAWCLANDFELADLFVDEGLSGHTMKHRAALQQALEHVCKHSGILMVYSLSRLARNTKETLEIAERLEQAGADLVSCSEKIDTTSAAGKMVFRMLAVLSEFERDQISERTTMAMDHKRQQGERISRADRIPYGMQLAADGIHLEGNPVEQSTMALARRYHARGISARQIAVKLAEKGHYSRTERPFVHTAILAMVRD